MHTMSTPYHPQGNGAVKRLNRSLAESLSKLVADNHRDWQNHLPPVQFAYNTTFHESNGSEINHITPSAYVSDNETAAPELYEAVEENSQRAEAVIISRNSLFTNTQ